MAEIPWTASQLTQGVSNALKARDFEAAVDLMKVLAAVDPKQAQVVYNTVKFGLALADGASLGEAIERMTRDA